MPLYALTIFAGAFLLFQVQPLIGKYILPWFGGGPGVWTTCMLFFQVLLLGGYAYAHVISRRLKPRAQVMVHVAILAAALALLPIIPSDSWKPQGGGNPTAQILVLLAACLGLPYFILSTTGPLMQQWFSQTNPGRSPYRLYALSNAGSLLALVSYPFYFESHFTRREQARFWGWGLAVYAICCTLCAWKLWRTGARSQESGASNPATLHALRSTPCAEAPSEGGSTLNHVLWLLLPACASVLLLATTNKMCLDVAVIPFLWILPLGLYLLSFIVCFDNPRWYARLPFTVALVAALAGICWAFIKGADASIYKQVGVYSGALFICCMVCHGELYRLRPAPERLTAYYLMIAAGGALGGVFVAVVAPRIFTNYYELHWGVLLCGLLFLIACAKDRGTIQAKTAVPDAIAPEDAVVVGPDAAPLPARKSWFVRMAASALGPQPWPWLACILPLLAFAGLDWLLVRLAAAYQMPKAYLITMRVGMWAMPVLLTGYWVFSGKFRGFRYWRLLTCLWLGVGWLALAMALWNHGRRLDSEIVYESRNFYGMLTVYEHRRNEEEGHHLLLQHGRITHGIQFVAPERAPWPTTYYGADSGVGLAMKALPASNRRIGLVGLGTATLTAYGRAGDYLRIYEINPRVEAVAKTRFKYLTQCPAKVDVVLGDARLSMEREPSQQFDLLALDAFSSDAIPVHLLTREAFELYGRHLKPGGILAVHISNHYLDLEPVVANLARHFNYKAALVDYDENAEEWWLYNSTWMLLTKDEQVLKWPNLADCVYPLDKKKTKVPLWTDDFTSLFQVLKN